MRKLFLLALIGLLSSCSALTGLGNDFDGLGADIAVLKAQIDAGEISEQAANASILAIQAEKGAALANRVTEGISEVKAYADERGGIGAVVTGDPAGTAAFGLSAVIGLLGAFAASRKRTKADVDQAKGEVHSERDIARSTRNEKVGIAYGESSDPQVS